LVIEFRLSRALLLRFVQGAHVSIFVRKQWVYANERVTSDAEFCLRWKLFLHLLIDFLEKQPDAPRSFKRCVGGNCHSLTVLSLDDGCMQPFGNGKRLRD
jgi:hypothetical protein